LGLCHYRYLLKIIAALPLLLLKKNSSELPLFATATFGALLKFALFYRSGVYFKKSYLEMFLKLSVLLCASL